MISKISFNSFSKCKFSTYIFSFIDSKVIFFSTFSISSKESFISFSKVLFSRLIIELILKKSLLLIFNIDNWVSISRYLAFDSCNILTDLFKVCLISLILWLKISSTNFSFGLGKLPII